jgi:hypothetical protein
VGKQEAKNGTGHKYVETIMRLFGLRHASVDDDHSSLGDRSGLPKGEDLA